MNNKLTDFLLAQGYTKDNHPAGVKWGNWNCFEYTQEALRRIVWESPCGLLKKGGCEHGSWSSYMGIDYSPENNNPRFGCPYWCEMECAEEKFWGGENCVYHRTDRAYDYRYSVDRINDIWDRVQRNEWLKATGGVYCRNLKWVQDEHCYKPQFDVKSCIRWGCKNETCLITKKPRDLTKVNIFYDILRTRFIKRGLFETTEREVEKGVKVFDKPVAQTDAEIWLKQNRDTFEPKHTRRTDYREQYFSDMHHKWADYDYFEFTMTPQNIRIERRETRDLLQDLQDVAEGIEVIHASDRAQKAKEQKRERKKDRQEYKARRNEKRRVRNLERIIKTGLNDEGEQVSDKILDYARQEMGRRGVKLVEQQELFG